MNFCCGSLSFYLQAKYPNHKKAYPDYPFHYNPKFREVSIRLGEYWKEKGPVIVIKHCPFCGTKLPESLRKVWFNRIEALGLDACFPETIPEPYKTDAWWKNET